MLTLPGIFLPLLIAVLLIVSGGQGIREVALEIIGCNLMISYLDIQTLGLSKITATIISGAGILLVTLGLILLAKYRAE